MRILATLFVWMHVQAALAQEPVPDFLLGPGDLVELNVQGEAGGRQQLRVGEDGRILAPLLGLFEVRGKSPEAAVNALAAAYVDGDWLREPQISMTLIEGRPYYVSGDVRQPGAYPSRPRMTIEEALAIAGGFRFAGFLNPFEYSEERLMQDLTAAWVDLFEAQLGAARRRAELEGAAEVGLPALGGNPLPTGFRERRLEDETTILTGSNADFDRRLSDLEDAIAVTQNEIAAAREMREQLFASREVLEELVAQQKALLERGLQVRANLFEAQQNLAAAVARLTAQDLTEGQAQRRLIDLRAERDRLQPQREARLLQEIAAYDGAALRLRASLETIETRRILAFSVTGSDEDEVTEISFQIRRGPPGARETIVATPATTILPGDILNVTVELSLDGR